MLRWGPAAAVLVGMVPHTFAAPYQDAVKNLNPTFYYELNEAVTDNGVIDTMGNAAAPGSYNGDYVNGPPFVGGEGPTEVFGDWPFPVWGEAPTSPITATTPARSSSATATCMPPMP